MNGTCTPAERMCVEEYLRHSDDTSLFDTALAEYLSQATSSSEVAAPDAAASLARFKAKRNRMVSDRPPVPLPKKRNLRRTVRWRVVAAWLVLLTAVGAAAWYVTSDQKMGWLITAPVQYREIVNHRGYQAQVTLPDGSRVWLNADSRLKFPEQFSNQARIIYLSGEAFFEVTHDNRRPFSVHTSHLVTTVLGTSFHVKSYGDENQSQVVVATGRVAVRGKNHTGKMTTPVVLHPQQRLVLEKDSGRQRRDSTDLAEITALKTGDLYLKDLRFKEIARRLERWYDVTIEFTNPKLLDCQFSAVFKRRSLPDILNRLQMTSSFTYAVEGRHVKITGEKCK